MRVNLRVMLCLPRPPGDEVAGLRSFRPINRAQEPRSRGGGSVAGALYAPAGLAGEHTWRFAQIAYLRLTRMACHPRRWD